MSRPPHTGQAGRGVLPSHDKATVAMPGAEKLFALAAIGLFIGNPVVTRSVRSETG